MNHTPRILVSACLLGERVRYDGEAKPMLHPLLARWRAEGRVVSFCPECAAGLPVPRAPVEIAPGATADSVLDGQGRLHDRNGNDATPAFLAAAHRALACAREAGCAFALLTDGSPSCGSRRIYDGRFSGVKRDGMGVAAALLRRHGIAVYAEDEIGDLAARLNASA